MRFFLHDMEELYNGGGDDDHGNIVKTFRNSENIFVGIIYRHRAIAYTFQHSLLKSSIESIKKSQIAIPDIDAGKTARAIHAFEGALKYRPA